jgi:hypothetical protein
VKLGPLADGVVSVAIWILSLAASGLLGLLILGFALRLATNSPLDSLRPKLFVALAIVGIAGAAVLGRIRRI